MLVWKASPISAPALVAAASSAVPGVTLSSPPAMLPVGDSTPPGAITPALMRVDRPALKAAQLMPVRSLSRSCTSTTLASSITWRSTVSRVASR